MDILEKLYEEIRHGDEDHQKWLKDKIDNFEKNYQFNLGEIAQKANGDMFNVLKLLEEIHECGELLVKTITKSKEQQDEKHLIEELGDLILRANIVAYSLGFEKINERIKFKTQLLSKYYSEKLTNGVTLDF